MFEGAFGGSLAVKGDSPMFSRTAIQHLAPHEGKSLRIGKFDFSFKAGLTVGSGYMMAEIAVPPGTTKALHRHPCEETMYVLAGEFEVFDECGHTGRAGPGSVVHVPQTAAHGFVNVGETTGRLLFVAPVVQETLFDDLSEAMASAAPDPAVAVVFARHHVETGIRADARGR